MRNFDAGGEPFRPARLFHYFMHDEHSTPLVVDVSEVWERRLAVARCFASQLHAQEPGAGGPGEADAGPSRGDAPQTPGAGFATLISRPDFLDRIEARARSWGRRAGVEFGEPLVVQDALAVSDVRALLAHPPDRGVPPDQGSASGRGSASVRGDVSDGGRVPERERAPDRVGGGAS
jgi:hypothetical protein